MNEINFNKGMIRHSLKIKSNVIISILSAIMMLSCADSRNQSNDNKTATDSSASPKNNVQTETKRIILFLGNSLTAGYGLDAPPAFPELIQQKIDSLQLPYQIINAGLSGETSAGGRRRIGWLLKQPVFALNLELGANDGLRGIALSDTKANLQAIIDTFRLYNPHGIVFINGMEAPPNMGAEFTSGFRSIFSELAAKNKCYLIPFLLKDVAGKKELNQADGIHPTRAGHIILARNIWEIMAPILQKETAHKP